MDVDALQVPNASNVDETTATITWPPPQMERLPGPLEAGPPQGPEAAAVAPHVAGEVQAPPLTVLTATQRLRRRTISSMCTYCETI
jgi:hypothetical protein